MVAVELLAPTAGFSDNFEAVLNTRSYLGVFSSATLFERHEKQLGHNTMGKWAPSQVTH